MAGHYPSIFTAWQWGLVLVGITGNFLSVDANFGCV
jgi:hypothetical protein